MSTNKILLCTQNVRAVNVPRQPCCQMGGVWCRTSEKGLIETGDPTDLFTPFRGFTGLVMEAVVAWVLKSSLSVLTTQCSGMLNSKVSGNSESTGFGYKFGTHPVLREKQILETTDKKNLENGIQYYRRCRCRTVYKPVVGSNHAALILSQSVWLVGSFCSKPK